MSLALFNEAYKSTLSYDESFGFLWDFKSLSRYIALSSILMRLSKQDVAACCSSNYIYNPRDFKYRVTQPSVGQSKQPSET